MKKKSIVTLFVFVMITAVFTNLGTLKIIRDSQKSRLDKNVIQQNIFRRQSIDESMLNYIINKSGPGEYLGLYWLETNFREDAASFQMNETSFLKLKRKWSNVMGYKEYIDVCSFIWNDVKYFPVAESTDPSKNIQTFSDSCMFERTYG